jgi:hypothetical protein
MLQRFLVARDPTEKASAGATSYPPQVKAAFARLLGHYDRTKATIVDLNGLLKDNGLQEAPRSTTKPGAIKLLYKATFPGEVLSLDYPDADMEQVELDYPDAEIEQVEKNAAISCSDDADRNDDDSDTEGLYTYGDDEYEGSTAGEYLGHVSLEDFGSMAYFNSILQLLSSSKEIFCFSAKMSQTRSYSCCRSCQPQFRS